MTVQNLPDRAELRELVDAVARHRLGSAELPSYLAGLAASPEMHELGAALERERLSPARLALRLKELLKYTLTALSLGVGC
jgi:hypothetical protein